MGTPERNSSTDRFSSMSVPERLSVDPDDLRTRKNSDLSNTSDNVSFSKGLVYLWLQICNCFPSIDCMISMDKR